MAIVVTSILIIFMILTFAEMLFIQAKESNKKILDLTLKEIFFQKRAVLATVLLFIIPSPILFFYYLYKIIKSK